MKSVGSIVFSTTQGLGIIAKSFFDNKIFHRAMVLRHGKRVDHPEWYPENKSIFLRSTSNLYHNSTLRRFLKEVEVMLFFETPFNWEILNLCRELRVKTFLMPMYECMPEKLPVEPDFYICPSKLDQEYYPTSSQFIPVPVDNVIIDNWRLRERAEVFVHNAGNWGLMGRNGTAELLHSIPLIKSPIKLIIRSQKRIPPEYNEFLEDPRVEVRIGECPYDELYKEGDVFVFPEKFNGLSLPLQEACASGMLVMCNNRFPMNTWLPNEPFIPVRDFRDNRISPRLLPFKEAIVTPGDIAGTIDKWYNQDISEFSLEGRDWGVRHSWKYLGTRYDELLNS